MAQNFKQIVIETPKGQVTFTRRLHQAAYQYVGTVEGVERIFYAGLQATEEDAYNVCRRQIEAEIVQVMDVPSSTFKTSTFDPTDISTFRNAIPVKVSQAVHSHLNDAKVELRAGNVALGLARIEFVQSLLFFYPMEAEMKPLEWNETVHKRLNHLLACMNIEQHPEYVRHIELGFSNHESSLIAETYLKEEGVNA